MQEFYDTLAEVLTWVIIKGMVLSKNKILLGQEIKYGRFLLSSGKGEEVDIKPDPDRLKDILDKKPSKNKQRLLSFLGLVNTLRSWSVGILCNIFHLMELSKKHVVFKWGQQENDKFLAIKIFLELCWYLALLTLVRPA